MTSCCSRVHRRENTLATHAARSTVFIPVLANCQAWFPFGLSSRILPQLSEIPVSGSLKTDQNPPLRVGRLISSCDICGAKTLPGRQMFLQPKQTEVSVHRTVLARTEETVFFSQTSDISQVLWMSVMGLGKLGPSSHFEPASQPATQPALEQASQSFLKGL